MQHEGAQDPRRTRAERPQDGNVTALFLHHHHQGGHDVECCHPHHQQQDHEENSLGDLDGVEKIGVLARPVADVHTAAERNRDFMDPAARLERIGKREAQAGDRVAQLIEPRGICQMQQNEAPIGLVEPGIEDPGHGQTAQSWHHAGRRRRAPRDHQQDAVPEADPEFGCERIPDHDIPAAVREGLE